MFLLSCVCGVEGPSCEKREDPLGTVENMFLLDVGDGGEGVCNKEGGDCCCTGLKQGLLIAQLPFSSSLDPEQ